MEKAAAAGRKPNLVFILGDDIGETKDLSSQNPYWPKDSTASLWLSARENEPGREESGRPRVFCRTIAGESVAPLF